MCQLLGVSVRSPTCMRFSWERFSIRGSEEAGNPDGWGVAFVDANDARLLREPVPAVDSPLVAFLGEHGPPALTVISHVRRATRGERTLANTQPFARVFGGRTHVFAHNGHIGEIEAPADPWLRPVGNTDSERLFCALLAGLAPLWRESDAPDLELRTEVIAELAETMRERGAANFLYYDGLTLFAHGHRRTVPGDGISKDPGLYLRLDDRDGVFNDPCLDFDGSGECGPRALVATHPLDDRPWRPLAHGELLRLEGGQVV